MPTPFPGMDPYLELSSLWPDVHNRLIVQIADALTPRLRPRYYVAIEERTCLVSPSDLVFAGRADVAVVRPVPEPVPLQPSVAGGSSPVIVDVPLPDEVHETYLEVRPTGQARVVTLLEILSPANKHLGDGRDQYLRKRLSVLGSMTNLVEIDLLRAGQPMPFSGYSEHSDYRILVSRACQRPRAELLPFALRQPIPSFRVPLLPGDEEPEIALDQLLHTLYDRAGYDLRINYHVAPEPPLDDDDQTWADELLRASGVR